MRFFRWRTTREARPKRTIEILEHLSHGRIRVRVLEDGKQVGNPAIILTSSPSAAYFAIPYAH